MCNNQPKLYDIDVPTIFELHSTGLTPDPIFLSTLHISTL